jgi:hypothetical protein
MRRRKKRQRQQKPPPGAMNWYGSTESLTGRDALCRRRSLGLLGSRTEVGFFFFVVKILILLLEVSSKREKRVKRRGMPEQIGG